MDDYRNSEVEIEDVNSTHRPPRFSGDRQILNRIIVILVIALIIVLIIAAPIYLLIKANAEKDELESQLAETERHLQLQRDLANTLAAQQSDQQSIIEALQEKLNMKETEYVITGEMISEQLNSLRELVTQEYIYTYAMRGTNNATWLWDWTIPFSNTSILVIFDGTINAGIDFDKINVDINEDEKKITVTLPSSRILDSYIPQESIQVLEEKDGFMNKVTMDDYTEILSQGKLEMEERAEERGLLTTADREARAAVKALLSLMPGISDNTYTLIVQ